MIYEKTLDVDGFSKRRTELSFPYMKIAVNGSTPHMMSLVEEGDIPLLGTFQGKTAVIKRVSRSAYNVDRLLKTHGRLEYAVREGHCVEVNSVADYLDLL